jgi:DNA-binding MarR family transcriptional regulator
MPDAPGFHAALSKHTGFLLSRIGTIAQRRFAERLAEIGLNPRAWGALNILDHEGPIAQHALGKRAGIDPSSMVSTIDELEAKGLVERQPNPSDRRAHALHITAEGRETLARGRRLAGQAQGDLLGALEGRGRALSAGPRG